MHITKINVFRMAQVKFIFAFNRSYRVCMGSLDNAAWLTNQLVYIVRRVVGLQMVRMVKMDFGYKNVSNLLKTGCSLDKFMHRRKNNNIIFKR